MRARPFGSLTPLKSCGYTRARDYQTGGCAIKITDVHVYVVQGSHERMSWVLVNVETDEGVVGQGGATSSSSPDTPGLGAGLNLKEVKKHLVA